MCRARDLCQTFSICHPGEKLASVWADLTLDIKEIGWLPIPRFPCSFFFCSSSQSLQGTGNSSGACVTVNNMPAWSCDQEMAKICFSPTNRSFCLCMLWTTKPASSSLQWAQLRRDSGDPHWWKAWRNQRGKDYITYQGSNVSNTGGSFFFEDLSYFTAKMWIMTLSCCLF